jgi:hypothetical protein
MAKQRAANRISPSQVGMLGVHLAAAEFIRRGFIVAPTSRGASGADLLVTDALCQKAWSIQVKTRANRTFTSWIVGKNVKMTASASLVYVLVSFVDDEAKFLVVPSRIVAKYARPKGTFLFFDTRYVTAIQKEWRIFGQDSRLTLPLKAAVAPQQVE